MTHDQVLIPCFYHSIYNVLGINMAMCSKTVLVECQLKVSVVIKIKRRRFETA